MTEVEEVMSALTPDPSSSSQALDEQVYEWVRERIINGTLQPGERIRERVLAEELKVSRIPIREAFPRLESEGYIKSLRNRGAIVAPFTVTDIAELFSVRSSLEVLIARLAAEQCAKGANSDPLSSTLREAEYAVAANDQARIAASTFQFHEDLLALSDNRLLRDLMAPVHGRVRRLFYIITQRDNIAVHREHETLCAAVVAGEVELAGAIARAHVEHSRVETMPIAKSLFGPYS